MARQLELKKWPFWRVCSFLTFLVLLCAAPIEDAAHGWSSLRQTGQTPGAPDFLGLYMGGKLARIKGDVNLYPAFTDKSRQRRFEPPTSGTNGEQSAHPGAVEPWLPFITPPFSALTLEPFAVMSWQNAYLAWQLTSIVMSVLALLFIYLTFSGRGFDLATFGVLVAWALAFHPFKMTINHGQYEPVILLAWALGLYCFA